MSFDQPINYPHEGMLVTGKATPEEVAYMQEQFAKAMELLGKHYCILFDKKGLVGQWFTNPEGGRSWARQIQAEYPDSGIQFMSRKSTTELEDKQWAQDMFEQYQRGELLRPYREDVEFLKSCGIAEPS